MAFQFPRCAEMPTPVINLVREQHGRDSLPCVDEGMLDAGAALHIEAVFSCGL